MGARSTTLSFVLELGRTCGPSRGVVDKFSIAEACRSMQTMQTIVAIPVNGGVNDSLWVQDVAAVEAQAQREYARGQRFWVDHYHKLNQRKTLRIGTRLLRLPLEQMQQRETGQSWKSSLSDSARPPPLSVVHLERNVWLHSRHRRCNAEQWL